MISFVRGVLVSRSATYCVVDVNGIGLRLYMPSSGLASLPADGETVKLLTYMHVREDEMTLYAFRSAVEREYFETLLGVGGIGPKLALAVISAMPPDTLSEAIASDDVAGLSSIPGVGKKTAQRMIVELKDKLGLADYSAETVARPTAAADARQALTAMGFSSEEVLAALKGYKDEPSGDGTTEDMIRFALKRMGGRA